MRKEKKKKAHHTLRRARGKEAAGWRGYRQTRTPHRRGRREKRNHKMERSMRAGGGRPVTPGAGGARRAERRQRGSGRAAARAAQSPGAARRGRGETYTARRARLSVGAAGRTGRRRPGLARRALLRSKLLWRPVGNCRRRAPCGWGGGGAFALVAASVPQLGNPWKSRRSRRCCGFGAVRWEGWGSGAADPAPPASWNW